MATAWDRVGGLLFRARSFTPLPVAGLIVWLSWEDHQRGPGPGGASVDAALNLVGLGLCALGTLWRVLTVASVPAGTSLQSRRLQTAGLNTTGPYAVVRHPLYFGNALMVLGLLCIAHTRWAWLIGAPYFLLSTWAIISAEEALLRERWGEAFTTWRAQVSAWRPRLSALRELRGPFAWKRAVQREVNPLVAWGCAATLLLMWEWFARTELTTALGRRALGTLVALLLLLAANKAWKRLKPATA